MSKPLRHPKPTPSRHWFLGLNGGAILSGTGLTVALLTGVAASAVVPALSFEDLEFAPSATAFVTRPLVP